jgi:replicative superfamily II helicase
MVDFKKHTAKAEATASTNPLELYESLDRASDKGPLRDAQAAALEEWHLRRRTERDVIVKLHTGQGKTLIGLLILQSKLNEGVAPAVYLCPNNFLVQQTATQAAQFGIKCILADPDLPAEFLDGKAILVTSVQKLFNGLTKFGIGPQSEKVGSIVLDDAHACIDAIRQQCMIRLSRDRQPYLDILNLFGTELEKQGLGTYADITNHRRDALLPVPYWEWADRSREVAGILSKNLTLDEIKFAWPLLRDTIEDCLCVISGTSLEIAPYLAPLHLFGSYASASHRVFMSATVTNDSFLIKGLGLSENAVESPLIYAKERWAGEKMILIPSLVNEGLSREQLVSSFAKQDLKRKFGIVVLAPSTYCCQDWARYGATIADKTTITSEVDQLLKGQRDKALVIVNRYDGIDLPDSACRILVLDSKPHSENLVDRYTENCRPNSEAIATKTARIIEQGPGRSVRGEKDFCVFVLLGPSLIKTLRTTGDRAFFSSQTRMQIEIGLRIAEFAKEDIRAGAEPWTAFVGLVNQCLGRDAGWKEYYTEEMNKLPKQNEELRMLGIFAAERDAESLHQSGDHDGAVAQIQKLLNDHVKSDGSDRGWYLQEMARYTYAQSKSKSNDLQISAHKMNRYLLRPKHGMQVQRLELLAQERVQNIISWIQGFASFEELQLALDEILNDLQFGVDADDFEGALNRLAFALGFRGQRPDKEWKEGPDNLWAIRAGEYILFECKSEVDLRRSEIYKAETGQMNNAIAWFGRHYPGAKVKNIMIIPAKMVGRGAGFGGAIQIMRSPYLKKLNQNVEKFFLEFRQYDLASISESKVNELLKLHHLLIDEIPGEYSEEPKSIAAN